MSMESAEAFVKRMYGDDEFLKDLFRGGAFVGGKAGNQADVEAQSRKFAEISKDFGYDFSAEEYDAANSAYVKALGTWKSIKVIFHVMKVGKSVEREEKRKKN